MPLLVQTQDASKNEDALQTPTRPWGATMPQERTGWWEHVVDEDENGFLRAQFDALSDHIHELTNRQVRWHQVPTLKRRSCQTPHQNHHPARSTFYKYSLLLINVWDVTAVRFLTDHLHRNRPVRFPFFLVHGERIQWWNVLEFGLGTWIGCVALRPDASLQVHTQRTTISTHDKQHATDRRSVPNGCSFLNELMVFFLAFR